MEMCFATLRSGNYKDPNCKYLCEAELPYKGGDLSLVISL